MTCEGWNIPEVSRTMAVFGSVAVAICKSAFLSTLPEMGCVESEQTAEPKCVSGTEKEQSSIVIPSADVPRKGGRVGKRRTSKDEGISSSDWLGLALVHRTL